MNYSNIFNSLVQYITREQDGSILHDVTYRSYDLDRRTGQNTYKAALRRLGRKLPELTEDLALCGLVLKEPTAVICRWFVWHRLVCGELRVWYYRKEPLQAPTETTYQELQSLH